MLVLLAAAATTLRAQTTEAELDTLWSQMDGGSLPEVVQDLARLEHDNPAVGEWLVKRFREDPRQAFEVAANAYLIGPEVRRKLLSELRRGLAGHEPMVRAASAMYLRKYETSRDSLLTTSLDGIAYTLADPDDYRQYDVNYDVTTFLYLSENLHDHTDYLSYDQLARGISLLDRVQEGMASGLIPNTRQEEFDALPRVRRALDRLRVEIKLRRGNVIADALRTGGIALGAHLLFWICLLVAYPRSPKVQAWFFWSPKMRAIGGIGYVGFLLTWTPFLRRRLLAPFREALYGEPLDGSVDTHPYHSGTEVRTAASSARWPIEEAIPEIRGQIVLEGHSGLGKTMFLRRLVACAARPTAYLSADRCADGVVTAVQRRLQGPASDEAFLRQLLYAGALDLCIDGLNEAPAETRARIRQFLEECPRANIIVATQPIDWGLGGPVGRRFEILPLALNQIAEFLYAFGQPLITEQERGAYLAKVGHYLGEVLSTDGDPVVRQIMLRVLSNPMDLSVVAQLLSRGIEPNLWALQQQQFEVVAQQYEHVNQGSPFPLRAFAEAVYRMRLVADPILPLSEFPEAVTLLESHRMAVRKDLRVASADTGPRYQFRHDKIADFFITHLFGGVENEYTSRHLSDVQFLGVYLILSISLPIQEVERLEQRLCVVAAETGDHSLSDPFTRMAELRRTLSRHVFLGESLVITEAAQ